MEPVYYTDQEYRQILSILEDLTGQSESLPYPEVKELLTSLLQYFDLMHREPLWRLFKYLETHAGTHLNELRSDFTIDMLFKLYDLVQDNASEAIMSSGFISADDLNILSPLWNWVSLGKIDTLEPHKIHKRTVKGNEVILVRMEENVYAMKNQCVDSILPLDQASLEYNYIVCPWHGCRYDVTTGRMLEKPEVQQVVYPIRVSDEGKVDIKVPSTEL